MNKTIQCFSIDSFKRDKWKLPFIRIGSTNQCNSILNDINGIRQYELPLSEFNALQWIYNHLSDFGNPDYIGFCHYRRFFSKEIESQNIACIQCPDELPPSMDYILYPIEQLSLMNTHNLDGIVPVAFYEHIITTGINPYQILLSEYFFKQITCDKAGFELKDVEYALKCLELEFNKYFKSGTFQYVLQQRKVYFGHICTLNQKCFNIWFQILFNIIISMLKYIEKTRLQNLNCRAFGYLTERLSSCIFHAFTFNGFKLMSMPLIVTNCNSKPKYQQQTVKDLNMKCDIDSFLNQMQLKSI